MSVELIGPICSHALVVDGREVPFVTAGPRPGGIVELVLDDRISLDVPVADLDRVGAFVADCIAVGLGYASHPRDDAEPVQRPTFRRWTNLAVS